MDRQKTALVIVGVEQLRIALFDRPHRLAGHLNEVLNFSFQGERLGCELPIEQLRIALFDRPHRLAGHLNEVLNFSFQGERLGCELPIEQLRIALFDRPHRLAGHLNEVLNFSFQGERLGCELPMLEGVPIALGGPASGPMHPADVTRPNRRRSAL